MRLNEQAGYKFIQNNLNYTKTMSLKGNIK